MQICLHVVGNGSRRLSAHSHRTQMGAKRASEAPKASPKAKAAKVEDPVAGAVKKVKASLGGVFASLGKEEMKKVKDALKELTPPTQVPDVAGAASEALAASLAELTSKVTSAKAEAEGILSEAATVDAEVAGRRLLGEN